jgi:hypothetical protein
MKSGSRILVFLFAAALSTSARADDLAFQTCLSGAQERPNPVLTDATGRVRAVFDCGLSQVRVHARLDDVVGFTAAHFHCHRPGENGPVVLGLINPGPCALDGDRIACTLNNSHVTGANCANSIGRPINNIAALQDAMARGEIYFNVHTMANPGGEIRGQVREHDGGDGPGGQGGNDDDEEDDDPRRR